MLTPRQPTPALTLPTLNHGSFDLAADQASWGTLVCFFRGYHCPICATYLKELERLTPEFEAKGVKTVAISSDGEERTRMMADKIRANTLRMAHSLPLDEARAWGLYISTSRGTTSTGVEEPALFSEPGVFLVRPDLTLYYAVIQTMPFSRPHFSEMLGAVEFVQKHDYPARGEYQGAV